MYEERFPKKKEREIERGWEMVEEKGRWLRREGGIILSVPKR